MSCTTWMLCCEDSRRCFAVKHFFIVCKQNMIFLCQNQTIIEKSWKVILPKFPGWTALSKHLSWWVTYLTSSNLAWINLLSVFLKIISPCWKHPQKLILTTVTKKNKSKFRRQISFLFGASRFVFEGSFINSICP